MVEPSVVGQRQRHPHPVRAGRVDTLQVAAPPVALPRMHDTVHRVLDHRFGGHARGHLDLRDLDQLTLTGAAPVLEGGQQRDPGVHTDDRIGGPLRVARRTVGVAGDRRHTRDLLEVQRPADVVAPRAVQAESRHPDGDHVGVQRHQRRRSPGRTARPLGARSSPRPRRPPRPAVARCRGPAREVRSSVRSRLLRLVPCQMGAALVPVVALVGEGARVAVPVGPLDRLDLDDVGAERAQVAGQVGPGPKGGQVQDPQPGEGQRPVGRGKRSGIGGPRLGARSPSGRRTRLCHRGFREAERRPGTWNDQSPSFGCDEEPALGVLRTVQHGGAVVDRRGRNAQRLAQFDDLGDGLLASSGSACERTRRARARPS